MAVFEYHKAGVSEAQQKKALAYLFRQDSAGLATDGVLAGLAVTQTTTASASVNVAGGAAMVQASTGNGASLMVNDTDPQSLDVLGANPMGGLARNDIVVIDQATGSLRVIVGTPNASPTDPSVPTSALALARIRNVASATVVDTAHIDDLRVFTQLAGDVDTGWITAASAGFTAASGFSGLSGTVRRKGGVVTVGLTITTTSAIGAGDIGNLTLVNVPAGWQCGGAGPMQGGSFAGGWNGQTNGSVITMGSTFVGFSAGATFSIVGTYLL